jgi:hypothetical protein
MIGQLSCVHHRRYWHARSVVMGDPQPELPHEVRRRLVLLERQANRTVDIGDSAAGDDWLRLG